MPCRVSGPSVFLSLALLWTGGVTADDEAWQVAYRIEGQEFDPARPHLSNVFTTFSPDGKLIAAAYRDGSVRLYDAETGIKQQHWDGHKALVWMVDFSPNGKQLISVAQRDPNARLWDVSTGTIIRTIRVPQGHAAIFSGDGRFLFLDGDELFDLKQPSRVAFRPDAPPPDDPKILLRPYAGAFSPDGKFLACFYGFGGERGFRVFNMRTGKIKFGGGPKPDHSYRFMSAVYRDPHLFAFSPDSTRFAASASGVLEIWDVNKGMLVTNWQSGHDEIHGIAWSPDSKRVALTSDDFFSTPMAVVINAVTGKKLVDLSRPRADYTIMSVCYSPDGKFIAGGRPDENTYKLGRERRKVDLVWNAKTGKIVAKLEAKHAKRPIFSSDSKRIVNVAPQPTVWIRRDQP